MSSTLGTIQFRNGIYQGHYNPSPSPTPSSLGIYFDDNLHFHCSTFSSSLLSSHTAILLSHAKYIYGEWQDGLPEGFNVFRSGDNVVLGIFEGGEIVGEFIVIFERQGYVVVGESRGRGKVEVIEKREFKNQVQLKKIISSTLSHIPLNDSHFSLIKYLNTNFCSTTSPIKLFFQNNVYNFGFSSGLRIVFDDDICIHKMGILDEQDQMSGLGVLFGKVVEIGNFGSGVVMKRKEGEGMGQEVKKMFRNQHKRAIGFRNDFMFTKTGEIVSYLEMIMKTIINQISQNPVDTERSLTRQSLNESMQYRPRAFQLNEQNQRLRMMREELHKSIGLPTSNIKPSHLDKIQNRYADDIKQLHLERREGEELEEMESISFNRGNGRTKEENRKSFVKENKLEDYKGKSGEKGYVKGNDNRNGRENGQGYGSRTYYNEPIMVGKSSNMKSNNTNSNKSINRQSNKSIKKSPTKPNHNSKYQLNKSPSRGNIPKESQVSTAKKDNKWSNDNYDTGKSHNTNKRHEIIKTEGLDDSLESPYRKHLFTDTVRENESKKETRKNSSREYIPISHNKTVNAVKKSPNKSREIQQLQDFNPKEIRREEHVIKPQSYIALYKNNSPTSNKTQQKSPPKKQNLSPLKNPYYQREPARSTKQQSQPEPHQPIPRNLAYRQPPPSQHPVYTKQPIYTNPYLKKSQQLEDSRKISPQRARMLDKISKKYNYTYDNL